MHARGMYQVVSTTPERMPVLLHGRYPKELFCNVFRPLCHAVSLASVPALPAFTVTWLALVFASTNNSILFSVSVKTIVFLTYRV